MSTSAPFKPRFYEEGGVWFYEDGRVLASVDFADIPADAGGGRALTISEWSSEHRNQGHSVAALTWLREQFRVITANGVGTLDDGVGDIATYYWAHMKRRGLVDVLLDDNGRELLVSKDRVHELPRSNELPSHHFTDDPITHIGTLRPQDKGVRGDSHEGHGLSVSSCPEDWVGIAKLGGQPWWELLPTTSAAPALFLDWHAVPQLQRDAMVAWAVDQGFAAPCTGFKVSWYDTETQDWRHFTLTDEAEARSEYDWRLAEHDDGPELAPKFETIDSLAMTTKALEHLRRSRADLFEAEELSALLYAEAMTTFVGFYWGDERDPANLSAPRAVVFPGRLADFRFRLVAPWSGREVDPAANTEATSGWGGRQVVDALAAAGAEYQNLIVRDQPSEIHEPLVYAIYEAVTSDSPDKLRAAIEAAGPELVKRVLPMLWMEFDGTMLYRAMDRTVLFANSSTFNSTAGRALIEGCAEGVRILRELGATCGHRLNKQAAGFIFLDTVWDEGVHPTLVEQLMRDSVAAGDFALDEPLGAHTNVGGVLPLEAAFHFGNARAVKVLLEAGASLTAPLVRANGMDIVSYAASFNAPRSQEIAALVAHALMSRQLKGADASRAAAAVNAEVTAQAVATAGTGAPSTDGSSQVEPVKKARRRMGL